MLDLFDYYPHKYIFSNILCPKTAVERLYPKPANAYRKKFSVKESDYRKVLTDPFARWNTYDSL